MKGKTTMTAKKNHNLPNQQILDEAYGTFCSIAESMVELNKLYFEQARGLFEANIENVKKLYQVNNPEELTTMLTHIMSQNSSIITKAFLEEFNVALQICNKICTSSQSGFDNARLDGFQVYDFYSKLLPNPVSLKIDEVVKSAANGNHDALCSLQQFTKDILGVYGQGVKETASSVLTDLDKLEKIKK